MAHYLIHDYMHQVTGSCVFPTCALEKVCDHPLQLALSSSGLHLLEQIEFAKLHGDMNQETEEE